MLRFAAIVLLLAGTCQAQLMPADKAAALRASFPQFTDPEMHAVAASPDLVLYTEAEMPAAFQISHAGQRDTIFEHVSRSFNRKDSIGLPTHPNREFPWRFPGGTDEAASRGMCDVFRFFKLPRKHDGTYWPVVVYRANIDRTIFENVGVPFGYRWLFPRETIFGECLVLNFADGYQYTYEVRTRERLAKDWSVAVYRPVPTRAALADELERRGETELANQLRRPATVRIASYGNERHATRSFFVQSGEYDLPQIPSPIVKAILTELPFERVTEPWYTDSTGVSVWAPTISENVESIVPVGYKATFVGADETSCVRCHEHTQRAAGRFENRDWYGHVRGCDGIFSWHPVDPATLGSRPTMRPLFAQLGMVETFDPAKHPTDRYQRATDYEYDPLAGYSTRGAIEVSGR